MLLVMIVFLILLFFGMPVAFSIGISGFTYFLNNPMIPNEIAAQRVIATTQNFTLLAVPLFILAGNLMNNTGITKRLVSLSETLTGHMVGSLAQVSVVMSTLMGGVSGSAAADAAMEARILGPDMIKSGYSRGYAAAINGLSALVTATIPPSIGLVIYGSVGEVSIGRLFAAGIVPGILMMAILMITVRITSKKRGYAAKNDRPPTLSEVGQALVSNIWALIFPIILIAGIRFGLFTPSEAGAFAIFYALFVGIVIYKELTWAKFIETLRVSCMDIGTLMMIMAMSGIFGYGIVYDSIPQTLAAFLIGVTSNPILLLLMIIVFLIAAGMFIETGVCALLLTPILLPVVQSAGIDPVHFGIIMMTILTSGVMSPPVGVALYSVSEIMGCKVEETVKEAVPFYFAIVVLVLILIMFPKIVLFLPNLIYG